ncbi:LacI family DNA-binding transcriptional regulator [Paenibacillus radicis (ex Xue et al. 2023)]|uniref:LacI family transcriptional regulator n=1 Tax=Paenibacillus radicis (ex Xue et al. 2023) TaxID=2972489 RepID=A0ABT1YJT6_9BACL|nr:LacI family DNA-binding transcriptional regulator [Paenibacillus radicis (ex Xue et al. 2023)]MCR8633427.1 LacI family transcriptional regulator [Paenibacillus radicis (ex Xue et al. 2023)]
MEKQKKKKYATLNDVAKLAETSIATVSYILNDSNKRYVSEDLKERVLQAAKELNYMKSAVASSLKGKERGILAVLVPQFDNPFFTRIIIAIEEAAHRHGYFISISTTVDDMDKERQIIQKMIEQRVDGLIISPSIGGTENTDHLRSLGIPYVILERPLIGVEHYDFVGSDNWNSGYSAVKHLVSQGHTRIGFIGWDTFINVQERKLGYTAAMHECGLQLESEWIQLGDLSSPEGYRLTEPFLNSNVTAIVFGHHIMAEGGIQLLREKGVRIPEDFSVVIIGTPSWTQLNVPKFTCISQSEQQIGEVAMKALMRSILDESETEQWHQEKIACELMLGESVKKLN